MQNPQAFNRYSYCINNPLKYLDPSGLDYIFVGGAGSEWGDDWWIEMLIDFKWNPTEDDVWFIANTEGGVFEIGDQYNALVDLIESKDPTDIKLIGHSEGAAAIAKMLDKTAEDDSFLADTNIRYQLTAAVLLDCPTGFTDFGVLNWDDAALVNLPDRLSEVAPQATLVDIHGTWIHAAEREGWEGHSHQIYEPWLMGYDPFGGYYAYPNPDWLYGHSDILLEPETLRIMEETFGIE